MKINSDDTHLVTVPKMVLVSFFIDLILWILQAHSLKVLYYWQFYLYYRCRLYPKLVQFRTKPFSMTLNENKKKKKKEKEHLDLVPVKPMPIAPSDQHQAIMSTIWSGVNADRLIMARTKSVPDLMHSSHEQHRSNFAMEPGHLKYTFSDTAGINKRPKIATSIATSNSNATPFTESGHAYFNLNFQGNSNSKT